MIRTRPGIWCAAIIIALAGVMLVTWGWYRQATWLHIGFGREMGDVLPIYAARRPYALAGMPGTAGRLLLAIGVIAVGLTLVSTSIARRWRTCLCVSLALAATFAINVAVARIPGGNDSFIAPFTRQGLEYFTDVRLVNDDPLKFIANYPKLNSSPFYRLSHHAGTHPPGGVLFLWLGEKLFGPPPAPPIATGSVLQRMSGARQVDPNRGVDAACWWAVAFTALAILPAYALARTIGGAAAARRLLPLYVATPNLVLFGATCMDGVFLTFALAALAAGFVAMRRWSFLWPIAAGLLLWLAAFFTFAAIAVPVLMGGYALCVAARRPGQGAPMIVRAAIVGVVFIAAQAAAAQWLGYDMRATADAAVRRDFAGLGVTGYESFEVWRNTSLGNLLGFTFGSGLAAAGLLGVAIVARRVPRRARAFSIAFPLCMAALACSTLFSMEVERVWLFLTPAALIVATRAFRGAMVWAVVLGLSIAQALLTEWWFNTWW